MSAHKIVEVAAAVLLRTTTGAPFTATTPQVDTEFLLACRPDGKVYAGYWEFPGGKLEAGESVVEALRRELQEELGISIAAAELWRNSLVDYPHALVRLHFCKVTDWTGDLEMREGQQAAWQQLPVTVSPVLAGTLPVLEWLAAERQQAL